MVPLSMPVRRRIRHMPQLLVPGRFGYKWLCFVVLIAYNEYFRLKLVKNHQQLYASNLEIDFGLVIDMPSFICTQKMFPFFVNCLFFLWMFSILHLPSFSFFLTLVFGTPAKLLPYQIFYCHLLNMKVSFCILCLLTERIFSF